MSFYYTSAVGLFYKVFHFPYVKMKLDNELCLHLLSVTTDCMQLAEVVNLLECENQKELERRNLTHEKLIAYIKYRYPTLLTSGNQINIKKAYRWLGPYATRVPEINIYLGKSIVLP